MKVIIKKAELLKQKKTLKIAKLSKVPESSGVTLTASERFSVTGQGFKNEMDCESLQWGTVTLPYFIWQSLVKALSSIATTKIAIEAENGKIRFQTIEMHHPNIKVTRLDRIASELSLNATHIQIIQVAFSQGIEYERLKDSAIWDTVKDNIKILRIKLSNAAYYLKEYGVIQDDLIEPLIRGLGAKDRETFFKLLFGED
jgi:hypothetical protein